MVERVFIFSLIFTLVQCDVHEFFCIEKESICKLENIRQDPIQIDFKINAIHPDKIKYLEITNSIIPVWTDVVCETFPNLEKIKAENNGLEQIIPKAFKKCRKLKDLQLGYNEILLIQPGTFEMMSNLQILDLSHNELTSFSGRAVRGLDKLNFLYINSNQIFDVNELEIIAECPHLEFIFFDDNNLRCKRIRNILTNFRDNNVSAMHSPYMLRLREQSPEQVLKFFCLLEARWNITLHETVNDVELMHQLTYDLTLVTTSSLKEIHQIYEQTANEVDQYYWYFGSVSSGSLVLIIIIIILAISKKKVVFQTNDL